MWVLWHNVVKCVHNTIKWLIDCWYSGRVGQRENSWLSVRSLSPLPCICSCSIMACKSGWSVTLTVCVSYGLVVLLCISPVMDWRPVQGVPHFSPSRNELPQWTQTNKVGVWIDGWMSVWLQVKGTLHCRSRILGKATKALWSHCWRDLYMQRFPFFSLSNTQNRKRAAFYGSVVLSRVQRSRTSFSSEMLIHHFALHLMWVEFPTSMPCKQAFTGAQFCTQSNNPAQLMGPVSCSRALWQRWLCCNSISQLGCISTFSASILHK